MVKIASKGYGVCKDHGILEIWVEDADLSDAVVSREGFWDDIVGYLDAGDGSDRAWFESGTLFQVKQGRPGKFKWALFVLVGMKKVPRREPAFGEPVQLKKRPVVRKVTPWFEESFDAAPVQTVVEKAPVYIKKDGEVKWNLGLKKHQVLVDGQVVFEGTKADALAVAVGNKSMAA